MAVVATLLEDGLAGTGDSGFPRVDGVKKQTD
jgi:hypothetical protein